MLSYFLAMLQGGRRKAPKSIVFSVVGCVSRNLHDDRHCAQFLLQHHVRLVSSRVLGAHKPWCMFSSAASSDGNMHYILGVVRTELIIWCATSELQPRRGPHSSDRHQGIFGNPSDSKCTETWGLLFFLIFMFQRHSAKLDARGVRLLFAGKSLECVVRTFQRHGRIVPEESRRMCFDAFFRAPSIDEIRWLFHAETPLGLAHVA